MNKDRSIKRKGIRKLGVPANAGIILLALFITFSLSFAIPSGSEIVDFGFKLYAYNFYGVSALKDEVWIVGSLGSIIHSSKDKSMFRKQPTPVTSELYDVCFVNNLKGWVVGRRGVVLGTEDGGQTWSRVKTSEDGTLLKVCAIDQTHAWAVGEWSTILHTEDGKIWSLQRKKEDKILNSVCFVDKDFGWAVGEFGTILHTQDGGKTWISQSSPLRETTNFSVSFKDRLHGVISAMDGRMLLTTNGGRTWSEAKSPVERTLLSVKFVNERIYAFGLQGTGIFSSDGGKSYQPLRPQEKGVESITWFSSCSFIDNNKGWIVGGNGRVLYTENGGQDWKSPLKLQIK